MTDSSDDSVHTVISVLDSHHSQSALSEDNLASLASPLSCKPVKKGKMGNRFGGEKKKDNKPEQKLEDKPKKKGKQSKNISKRNSQSIKADVPVQSGGASSVTCNKDGSTRPDVLANLGANSAGPSLASPSGSQCTWSYDEESDVSTLGYSTPLSTPQIHRYVMPKQAAQQQTSTERLEELSRTIEKNIIDNLSDTPPMAGGASVSSKSTSERKGRRNVKKKRVLGQAVIDSEIFILPIQDMSSGQPSSAASDSKRLNVDNKICLRASQESPVSAWLRDDDTPIDEEQMDEMFISCIDLSYSLTDICSEKEFTEYGSLESRKQAKAKKSISKEASLSPNTARRPLQIRTPPLVKREIPRLKAADSRNTPPKSDSSTSTLAEVGLDIVSDICSLDQRCSPLATATETMEETHTYSHDEIAPQAHNGCEKQSEPKNEFKSKSKNEKVNSEGMEFYDGSNVLDVPSEVLIQDTYLDSSILTKVAADPGITSDATVVHEFPSREVNDNDVNIVIESNLATISEDARTPVWNIGEGMLPGYESDEPALGVRTDTDIEVNSNSLTAKETSETIDNAVTEYPSEVIPVDGPSPPTQTSPKHVPPPSPSAMDSLLEGDKDAEQSTEFVENDTQMKEVQLFSETVFKRLSSLAESQSQEEDILTDFDDIEAMPLHLGSLPSKIDDACQRPGHNTSEKSDLDPEQERTIVLDVLEDQAIPSYSLDVEPSVVRRPVIDCDNASQIAGEMSKDDTEVEDGTLKRKKRKKNQKKHNHDRDNTMDLYGNVIKRPEIPDELKQVETQIYTINSGDPKTKTGTFVDETEINVMPPKRESQQIKEVIDLYGLGETINVGVEHLANKDGTENSAVGGDSESCNDNDTDGSSENGHYSDHPNDSSLELASSIPPIEDTFNELLSVKHILDDSEDKTPTEESFPVFIGLDSFRSHPECVSWRRSRMSPAVIDRTESDLDVSEQRDDISTDSMYADDEDDGASEVQVSRSYNEPAGNEVVVSCTFYNTQHNAADSDDFWEDYTTADETYQQIEISADAATATFQNARKQMQDIHRHLQDLRRQMEHLQEEVENATLTPEYAVSSEDKRIITE